MLKFKKFDEPEDFDEQVRRRGNLWLMKNLRTDPPNHWHKYILDLRKGFSNLCAYSTMYAADGVVDHYLSKHNHRHLIYEWSNYRFCRPEINSSKGILDDQVLDPFEIEEGWFEITIPGFLIKTTNLIPNHLREKANFTIDRLRLNGEKCIQYRYEWFHLYNTGELSFPGLCRMAPLVAIAAAKLEETAG